MGKEPSFYTFKIKNPEAAHRWAMAMGSAQHLICGWQSLGILSWLSGDTADFVYYFDNIEIFLQAHETLELFTDHVDKCLIFENDKDAFKCFDDAAAYLCEHDIPERHWLLEFIIETALSRRYRLEDAEWECMIFDFCAAFGMNMEESAVFISEVEAKMELKRLP